MDAVMVCVVLVGVVEDCVWIIHFWRGGIFCAPGEREGQEEKGSPFHDMVHVGARFLRVMTVYPNVAASALVGEGVVMQGQVTIGPDAFVCPNAVLRGDIEPITVERGANVQDCCVVHTSRGNPAVIEEEASIGHGAVIHGATIKKSAMIGMNAVVLDGAVIGEQAVVGAGCIVPMGMDVPARSLVVGAPARIVKEDDDRIADIAYQNGVRYLRYRDEHIAGEWGTTKGPQEPKA